MISRQAELALKVTRVRKEQCSQQLMSVAAELECARGKLGNIFERRRSLSKSAGSAMTYYSHKICERYELYDAVSFSSGCMSKLSKGIKQEEFVRQQIDELESIEDTIKVELSLCNEQSDMLNKHIGYARKHSLALLEGSEASDVEELVGRTFFAKHRLT